MWMACQFQHGEIFVTELSKEGKRSSQWGKEGV